MITYEEAYAATDPSAPEEQRKNSANAILLGMRANQVYWDSRPELEALRAQAEGHGLVVRGDEESPTEVGTSTDPNVIEGTATEEPVTGIETGATATEPGEGTPPAATPTETPQGTSEADRAERLRAQLRNAGIEPEA